MVDFTPDEPVAGAPLQFTPDQFVPDQPAAQPSFVSSFLDQIRKAFLQSGKDVAGTLTGPFKEKTGPAEPLSPSDQLAQGPMQWGNPASYGAKLGAGIGSAGPMVAGAAIGGAGGEAIEPVGGGLVGAPAGAFIGSVVQELAPAYQAARARGLTHEQAVNEAWASAAVSGGTGALMTIAPVFRLFGTTAEGALKRPVSEMLAQIFGVQPAIGTAGSAAQAAVTGQPVTPEQLAETYATNVGAGAAMVGAHQIVPALRRLGAPAAEQPPGAPPAPVPITPDIAPAGPAAAPVALQPGAVVGVRGAAGPVRAQIERIGDGLVHWTGPDGVPRVDDLAHFQRDIVPAPPPADVIKGDATTVGAPPPPPAGEPPITAPDQFGQAFRAGPAIPTPEPLPPRPPSPQGAMPLPDTTAIDATLRAASTYRVNAEKARIAGTKTPEQIGDMERIADQLEADAHNLRAQLAAPRVVPTDVVFPEAPKPAETLLNRPAAPAGPEPTLGPPSLGAQLGELGRNAPAETVATTGQQPVMGTKPKPIEAPAKEAKEVPEQTGTAAPEIPKAQFTLEPPTAEPTPAGRPPAAEKPEMTLIQFLRMKGVQDPEGELRAMDLHLPKYGVGKNAVIRKGGQSLEDAALAAQEAGYLGQGAGMMVTGEREIPRVTSHDLVDALRNNPNQYPIGKAPVDLTVDTGRESDMREIDAMNRERRALMADLASLGDTDLYHLDNEALKDRLEERLAMTGMDNVEDARRAVEAEEQTLKRLADADAAWQAAVQAEGGYDVPAPEAAGAEPVGNEAGAPEAPVSPAAEVTQAGAGPNQTPGTTAEGGQRAPSVENIPTVEGPKPHYVLPGMEQSARQAQAAEAAQAAREGKTEIGARSKSEQLPPNEGLFAPAPTPPEAVIPGIAAEKGPADPGAIADGIKQVGKTFGQMLLDDSGAVPRREKLLTSAEKAAAELKRTQPDSLRGITKLAQFSGLAQSISEGHAEGAHYMTVRDLKKAARGKFQNDAQDSAGAWLRLPEKEQTAINKVLEYQTMTNREIENTGRPIVVHYDPARDFPGRPNPLQIIQPGETVRLSPKLSAMVHDINEFMDRAWKQMAQADAAKFGYNGPFLREGANGRLEFDMPGIQEAIRGANDRGARLAAERALGFATEAQNTARKGYFPLMRYGDWNITIKPKVPVNPEGHVLRDEGWFSKVDSRAPFESLTSWVKGPDLTGTPKRVQQEMAKLRQRFPDADYHMTAQRADPKTADTVDLAMVNRVLQDTKLVNPETGERLADDVIANLYDQAKAGYRQPREGVPGYTTDFARAFSDYARQWSNVTAEKLHGNAIREAYDATQQGPDKRAAEYWKNYHAYNENPSKREWLYSAMKRVGFLNYLWGSPSSAAIQLTQTPLLTGTQAGLLIGHARAQYMAGTILTRAMGAVRPTGKGLALDIKDMGGITARERAGLMQADKEGRLQPVLPTDFAGGQFSPEMRRRAAPLVRAYDIGASAFNTADRANRITAWLTAYRAAQMPGVAAKAARLYRNDALYREQVGRDMDPAKYANWFVNETQFLSGREGSSPLMRGPGSVLFQFQHYNTNMMRVMRKNMMKMGPEGKAAFAVMGAGLVLGAGLGGLPFVNDAERLVNEGVKWWNNDIDPRLDAQFREMIQDSGWAKTAADFFGTDPAHVAEATTEGLSRSALGLDLGRRIGLGNILPSNTDLYTAVPFLDATLGKAIEVWKRYHAGQTTGAVAAALPAALQNPVKAFGSWPSEGIGPQGGGPPYFKASQVTPGMQVARAFGFQPAAVARRQEFMADQNAIKFLTDAPAKQLLKAVSDAYGRSFDASQHGDIAGATAWHQQAEAMLKANAERLRDPNIEAWQQIPQPMAKAIQNRVKAYLLEPGTLSRKTDKMKAQEMLNSPYLSQ